MTASVGSIARVAGVVSFAVLFQLTGVAELHVLGGGFDLIPIAVGAIAYYAGSVPGAATGFGAGLLVDVVSGGSLGASSLLLTSIGYLTGRFRELRDPAHGLMPIAVVAAVTAAYEIGYALLAFMLGIEASISVLVLREMTATVLLNCLLALPLFWLTAKLLGPALPLDPLSRGRRARAVGSGPIGLRGLEAP